MLGSSPHQKQHQLLGDYSGNRLDIFVQYDIQLFFYSWLAQILHISKGLWVNFHFTTIWWEPPCSRCYFFPQSRRTLQLLLNVKIMHSFYKNVKQYGKRHKDKSKINPKSHLSEIIAHLFDEKSLQESFNAFRHFLQNCIILYTLFCNLLFLWTLSTYTESSVMSWVMEKKYLTLKRGWDHYGFFHRSSLWFCELNPFLAFPP